MLADGLIWQLPAGVLLAGLGTYIGHFNPDRRMIARLLPPAHVAVDLGVGQAPGEAGAEQQVIDPKSGVAQMNVPQIVPERCR